MEKRHAIAIGVERCGTLTRLPGAIAAAETFGAWATARQFASVKVITDMGGEPVLASEIKAAVKAIVDKASGDESLFIYYAGHGVLSGASVDTWLLSDWENDPNEVINVTLSSQNARTCGLGHVVLISDACRTSGGKGTAGLGGIVIFTHKQVPNIVTQWDEYYATRRGIAAQMPVPDKQILKAYPIFSSVLFEGLKGAAVEHLTGGPEPNAVTAQRLRDYVEREVPLRSGALPGGFTQYAEATPSSKDPFRVYAWLDWPEEPDLSPDRGRRSGGGGMGTLAVDPSEGMRGGFEWTPPAEDVMDEGALDLNRKILGAAGRESFETQVGLTVVGARVVHAEVRGGGDLFTENGAQHVRGHGAGGLPAALLLDDERWIVTTMFPGYVGTILVGERGVESVSYVLSRSSPRYSEWEANESRKVLAKALAEHAFYGVAPGGEEGVRVARELRQLKQMNPSLGILAAHAYFSAARFTDLISVAEYMERDAGFVPYDILRLVERYGPIPAVARMRALCAGAFPILTLGWALIDRDDDSVHPIVRRCLPGILPSTWAMLRPREGAMLANAIKTGEI